MSSEDFLLPSAAAVAFRSDVPSCSTSRTAARSLDASTLASVKSLAFSNAASARIPSHAYERDTMDGQDGGRGEWGCAARRPGLRGLWTRREE